MIHNTDDRNSDVSPEISDRPAHVLNVLLVEDDAANRGLFVILLREIELDHFRLKVTTAENGVEALRLIQSRAQRHDQNHPHTGSSSETRANAIAPASAFDLIFMDCRMPEMDGYEATRRIRAIAGATSAVTIIGLTASAMMSAREDCLAIGMDDYIDKPVAIEDLTAVVRKWLPHMLHIRNATALT